MFRTCEVERIRLFAEDERIQAEAAAKDIHPGELQVLENP
jgi:hypothetical protein